MAANEKEMPSGFEGRRTALRLTEGVFAKLPRTRPVLAFEQEFEHGFRTKDVLRKTVVHGDV